MKARIPGMLRRRGEKVKVWLARLLRRLWAFSRLTCGPLWQRLAGRLKETLQMYTLITTSHNSDLNFYLVLVISDLSSP